jgi:hypothetical protein
MMHRRISYLFSFSFSYTLDDTPWPLFYFFSFDMKIPTHLYVLLCNPFFLSRLGGGDTLEVFGRPPLSGEEGIMPFSFV